MSPTLAELRQEIDEIDTQLHDLIMRRAEFVGQIQAAKPAGLPTIRLAREAQILRRLVVRHKGKFPPRALVQMWQEMIDAFTWLQGSLRIAAHPSLAALIRTQYGVLANIRWEDDSTKLIELVMSDQVSLAALPWPGDWWYDLASSTTRPTIVGSLPFFAAGNNPEALVVAQLPFEPSGDDFSLIASSAAQSPFAEAELIAQNNGMRLFRIASYIAPDDAGLDSNTILLGGYPKPLIL